MYFPGCATCRDEGEMTFPGQMESNPFHSVEAYLHEVKVVTQSWNFDNNTGRPWFRGCRSAEKHSLVPSVFRNNLHDQNGKYDEFNMTTMFRNRSPVLGGVPHRNDQDQWLFLMQHYGLPTRLLDWTESALTALFFAVDDTEQGALKENAAVWLLHPIELNKQTLVHDTPIMDFPNTWTKGNIGNNNIQLPFLQKHKHKGAGASVYPLAIQPTYSDARQRAQDSCFTIHGLCQRAIEEIFNENSCLVKNNHLKKLIICQHAARQILHDLKGMGVTRSTVFPDLSGLAADLRHRFFVPNSHDSE